MTLPEVLLWQELRGRPYGFKFRRQHPIGSYVINFYCAQTKLGIEVDGVAHDMGDRPERDRIRDDFVRSQSINVMRVSARDLLADSAKVAEAIVALCRQRSA